MITIDGSMGEGGGQVLRTSLALSILTGQGIHLYNIRAGRQKPGLQAQHVQAVKAAAAICQGEVQGVVLHSRDLVFEPGEIHAGRYRFDIGTAGAATLVLQTIYLPLARGKDSSQVSITGGTHVPFSPSFHYLERQWLPVMQGLGFWMKVAMEKAGFYPVGGGVIEAHLRPVQTIQPLRLMERGALLRVRGISAVSNLEDDIARRQKLQALRRLEALCQDSKIETLDMPSEGKGTMLLVQGQFEHTSCTYFDLGAPGKRAEKVADEAVDDFAQFLQRDGAVDEHLADQLVLPLAFATGESQYRTSSVTRHLLTQAELVPMFMPVNVRVDGAEGEAGTVTISP